MRFYLSVAWRNLLRQSRRTFITAAALAVGAALSMGMWAWGDGMMAQMFTLMVTQQLGHVQVHHPDWARSRVLYDTVGDTNARLTRIDALPGAQAASARLVTFGLVGTPSTSVGARIVGVLPTREDAVTAVSTRLDAGRYLSPTDARDGAHIPAVVGRGLAKKLQVGVGDELVFLGQSADGSMANELLRVVGVARTGNAAMDRAGVYVPLPTLQEVLVLPDRVHEIVVLGVDPQASAPLADAVRDAIGPGEPPTQVRTWAEADPITARMMAMTDGMMVVMLLFVFSAGGMGVLNTMLMAVFERTRELGLLKALGLKPRQIVTLLLTESALLGLVAAVGGLVLGLALDAWLVVHGVDLSVAEGRGFEYEGVVFDPVIHGAFRWSPVWITLLVLFCVAMLASLWPAIRASRLRPVDAMRSV